MGPGNYGLFPVHLIKVMMDEYVVKTTEHTKTAEDVGIGLAIRFL